MDLQFRVRTYQSAGEFEAALHQEAKDNWHLDNLCSHGPVGVLAVYRQAGAAAERAPISPADHAAQVAEEANVTHEFSDPRAED